MKAALCALAISAAAIALGTPAQAQNYPWCAYYNGSGGARNCGFISFAQCQPCESDLSMNFARIQNG